MMQLYNFVASAPSPYTPLQLIYPSREEILQIIKLGKETLYSDARSGGSCIIINLK